MNFDEIFAKIDSGKPKTRDDRVLIVDSLNSFLRVWASIPTISNNGEHVGGILGFLRSVGSNIRDFNPSRCILVFDGSGGSLRRRKLFPEYKQNRKNKNQFRRDQYSSAEDEKISMRRQMSRILEYLEHLPVQVICVDNIEADDTIAYLTMQYFEPTGSKVRIVSTDRDFLQLVSDNVEVYSPVKKKLYTPSILEEEFKFKPNNYLLYRTIDGDGSDGIPGVNGIGIKTLLKEFPELSEKDLDLEYLLSKSKIKLEEEKKPKKIFQNLIDNTELLERNYKLMQLQDTDISLNSKMLILNKLESEVTKVNKAELRRFIAEDYLTNEFKNLDNWLQTTFSTLNLWAQTK
jgi:DNA polymerase-1